MAYLFAQADAARLPLPSKAARLCIGSPPYCDARTYGIGADRACEEWIEWMLRVTEECLRCVDNCVVWVAAGVTRDRNYWPACEGLMWEWYKRGGSAYRPCYWHRVGIPGSGHNDWFRADVEMCMVFKRPGPLPFSNNTACGHPPKWGPGGEMSNRVKDGHRRNQWGKHENSVTSSRKADGEFQGHYRPSHVYMKAHTKRMKGVNHKSGTDMKVQYYVPPILANPGNAIETREVHGGVGLTLADLLNASSDLGTSWLHTTTGGGQLGWAGAHENEAPYPERVPEFFIKSLSEPGDLILDPFLGSGTSARVAERLGRGFVGFDLRHEMCSLAVRGMERPHKPIVKRSRKAEKPMPLLAGMED